MDRIRWRKRSRTTICSRCPPAPLLVVEDDDDDASTTAAGPESAFPVR